MSLQSITRNSSVRLGLLLFPQFSLMAFSAALEPLRSANRLLGREFYRWTIISPDGDAVTASNGIPITAQAAFDPNASIDMLLVCIGLEPLQVQTYPGLRGALRQLASRGCLVGGVSGGPFLLAEAGLLDGRRCTVHWEYADFFAARYPRARLQPDVYVVDRGVFTCSGGTAALDMMLHFIRYHHGPELALAVAEQFIHPRIRGQGDRQRMAVHTRYRITSPKLAEVIALMERTGPEASGIAEIADQVALSTRQVERLFQRHLATSPSEFYLGLRLARARTLLRETSQSVRAIAGECGFKSTSHFSSAYRRAFAQRPTDERQPAVSVARKKTSAGGKHAASRQDKIVERGHTR